MAREITQVAQPSALWTEKAYIADRTEYYRRECKKLPKWAALDCAKSDWQLYLEKYGAKEKD